eukprot:1974213-Amphidinium_carterae.2
MASLKQRKPIITTLPSGSECKSLINLASSCPVGVYIDFETTSRKDRQHKSIIVVTIRLCSPLFINEAHVHTSNQ